MKSCSVPERTTTGNTFRASVLRRKINVHGSEHCQGVKPSDHYEGLGKMKSELWITKLEEDTFQ